jgi:anionic cell wall polymer biosynthesis LytR-Cps2A-Psr (LCP) family protein
LPGTAFITIKTIPPFRIALAANTGENNTKASSFRRESIMKKIYAYALVLVLLALVGTAVWGVISAYKKPMGQPLEISQANPTAVVAAAKVDAKPEAKPQPQAGACGQKGKMKVLAIGSDRTLGVEPPGADGVRLIQVDFNEKKVIVAAFSRDLDMRIKKGLADPKIRNAPLGLAYHLKFTETKGSDRDKALAATNFLAELLYDTYKIVPDHYLTTELKNFAFMVNELGGLTVNNPTKFVGTDGTVFEVGSLSLNGAQATEFMRTYDPGGEVARMQRQNVVMKGLRDKLMEPATAVKIPGFYDDFQKIVFTDLSLEKFNALNCMLTEVPKENILTYDIGPDERVIGPDGKPVDTPRALQAILNELFKD